MLVWQIQYDECTTCTLSKEYAYKLMQSLRKRGINYIAQAYTVHKWITRYICPRSRVWVEIPSYSLTAVNELECNLSKLNTVQYTVWVY